MNPNLGSNSSFLKINEPFYDLSDYDTHYNHVVELLGTENIQKLEYLKNRFYGEFGVQEESLKIIDQYCNNEGSPIIAIFASVVDSQQTERFVFLPIPLDTTLEDLAEISRDKGWVFMGRHEKKHKKHNKVFEKNSFPSSLSNRKQNPLLNSFDGKSELLFGAIVHHLLFTPRDSSGNPPTQFLNLIEKLYNEAHPRVKKDIGYDRMKGLKELIAREYSYSNF